MADSFLRHGSKFLPFQTCVLFQLWGLVGINLLVHNSSVSLTRMLMQPSIAFLSGSCSIGQILPRKKVLHQLSPPSRPCWSRNTESYQLKSNFFWLKDGQGGWTYGGSYSQNYPHQIFLFFFKEFPYLIFLFYKIIY